MSLIEHAKRELELIGEEKEFVDAYLAMIEIFSNMGHSGGSASVFIPTLNRLFQYKNLSSLTDDPDEWQQVSPDMGFPETTWQSRRDSEAFSNDGGKTYRILSEARENIPGPLHESEPKDG